MNLDHFIENAPFTLSEEDKAVLRQAQHEFKPHTWDELKAVIAAGEMSTLKRSPHDLRNYLTWCLEIVDRYGTVADYVRQHKLNWQLPIVPANRTPFADPYDYKIIRNDWPYGMTSDITHMVAWLKTPIDVTPEGNPTPESRGFIEGFVEKMFGKDIGLDWESKVMWFKQRVQWQSVRALEHIHVIVRGVDESLIEKWTGQNSREINSRNSDICDVKWLG